MITSRQINGPIILRNTLDAFKNDAQQLPDYRAADGAEYTMRVYVRGVVELKDYTGGTTVGTYVKYGATAVADNRTIASLALGVMARTYFLNYSAGANAVGCADLIYSFDIPSVAYTEIFEFTLDGVNTQIYEPRDPASLSWFETSPSGSYRDPQFMGIVLAPLDAVRAYSTGFSLSGFIDNVRKGGQR